MVGSDIFFFKQKTAYELRISDWSSDVCSSDLSLAVDVSCDYEAVNKQLRVQNFLLNAKLCFQENKFEKAKEYLINALKLRPKYEIGRASCRERVCQYV